MGPSTGEISCEKEEIKWNIKNFRRMLMRHGCLWSPIFTFSKREHRLSLQKESDTKVLIRFYSHGHTPPNDLYLKFQLRVRGNIESEFHGSTFRKAFLHKSVCIDFTEFCSKDFITFPNHLTVLCWVRELKGSGVLPDESRNDMEWFHPSRNFSKLLRESYSGSFFTEPCTAAKTTESELDFLQPSFLDVGNSQESLGAMFYGDTASENETSDEKETNSESEGTAEESEDAAKELCEDETDSDYESLKTLQKDFEKLLLDSEDSDVTFEVQGIEIPAHRNILRARSPVFNVMFKHKMKERDSNIVTIEDSDPKTFPDFLKYLYTGSTKHLNQENVCQLYTASDKYEVMELKAKCAEFMKSHISVETFCEYFSLAHVHNEKELLDTAIEFFNVHTVEIAKTVKWQIFLHENSTVGNELFLKALTKGKNI